MNNQIEISYIPEVVFGTTPTDVAPKQLRFTGESLNYDIASMLSSQINTDRQLRHLLQLNSSLSGDINFELSFQAYDNFFEALFFSTWDDHVYIISSVVSVATDTTNRFETTDATLFADVKTGSFILIDGFSIAANNGIHFVTSVATLSLTTNSTLQKENAGNDIWIRGRMLRNGVTKKTFSVQKQFDTSYFIYKGMCVSSMSLDFTPGALVTGNFNFIGKSLSLLTTTFTSEIQTDSPAFPAMSASKHISQILNSNVPLDECLIKDFKLNYTNNLRQHYSIGERDICSLGVGAIGANGSTTIYFKDKTFYETYLSGGNVRLSFVLKDESDNYFIITLPRIKFTQNKINASGTNQDCLQNITFECLRDSTTDCMIQLDSLCSLDDLSIPTDAFETESGSYIFMETNEFITLE